MSTARVRAPELTVRPAAATPPGGGWFGTDPAGAPLTLAALRGRFVLLDFWSFCCGNCLHVLDELRPWERARHDVLSVIGIHSPKFPHEADPDALAAAIERYDVDHPVLNDPGLTLWQQYAVKAWPTLVLVDPEGYVVAQAAGEGQVSALDAMIEDLIPHYEARGTLRRGDLPTASPPPAPGTLRFPASLLVLPRERTGRDEDGLLVADTGHHRLAELAGDGATLLRAIGSGLRGHVDGSPDEARFAQPNGVELLPADVAREAGYDVLVADTANHVLRGVRLADGAVVRTLDLPAALAEARTITGAIPAVLSPWDVAWWPALARAVVAAAGVHLLLSVDPVSGATSVLAGTTVEGLRDGPALEGWLAQPSGLAVDGERLWFADSESSALRWLDVDGVLHTAVGEGLFDFGHVDGPAAGARLQHPLGVTVLPDATLAVHDTYNGAVRRYDPRRQSVDTLTSGLAEPSGGVVVDGVLLVAESAAHRLTTVGVAGATSVTGAPLRLERPPITVAPGALRLEIAFTPAPGRAVDDRFGPATRLSVAASPTQLLVDGAGEGDELVRVLRIADDVPVGTLHVTAQAASCDEGDSAHAACYLSRQDWGVPLVVDPSGASVVRLVLLG